MLSDSIFRNKTPIPASDLPLTLMSLDTWILIKLNGTNTIQYLHNQITCDVKNLNEHQYSFAAYCNPKGKMINNMYVFFLKKQEIAFIEPINISKKQISTMQKYAVFSDITITPDYNAMLIGVAGQNAKKYLNTFFNILPNKTNTVVRYQDIILLYFNLPIERFLLIVNNKSLLTNLLNKSYYFSAQYNNHVQWTALDIEAGYPYIDLNTSELFFPQAANMDLLHGISFTKGCYLGQELIARIQHYKLNKQSVYQLIAKTIHNEHLQLPISGDYVKIQTNYKSWKNIGIVLQSCLVQTNYVWIQAILYKSSIQYDQFKIHNNHSENSLNFQIII